MNIKKLSFEFESKNKSTKNNIKILQQSIISARNSNKIFKSGAGLLKNALRD